MCSTTRPRRRRRRRPGFRSIWAQGAFSPFYTLDQVGGPTGSLSGSEGRVLIDVNGDGLTDIYQPGQLWLNTGHTPDATITQGTKLFQPVVLAPLSFGRNRVQYAFVMDIDNDGKQELIMPDHRSSVSTYCGGDATKTYGPDSAPAWFCGDEFDTAPQEYWSYDRSIFVWTAYRFVEDAQGAFSLVAVPTATPLEAPINYKLSTGDDDA